MKRNPSLIEKVKVFIQWLRRDYALISSCTLCESTRIRRVSWDESDRPDNSVEYKAEYECQECKAKAQVVEIWKGA